MFGLVVIEVMTLSGHLSNINEMMDLNKCHNHLLKRVLRNVFRKVSNFSCLVCHYLDSS